jgi:methyl-accepting chemotaxis protein
MPIMKISNLKFISKIFACVGLLALVVAGAIWFASARMVAIDTVYSTILTTDVVAMKDNLRANQRIVNFGRLAWQMVAETDVAAMKKIAADITANHKDFSRLIDEAKRLAPRFAAPLEQERARFEDIAKDYQVIEKLALSNHRENTLLLINAMALKAADLRNFSASVTTEIEDAMRATSDNATTETWQTVTLTVGWIGAALVVVLAIAFLLVQVGIVRPLKALVRSMQELASGNFEIVLPGLGRKDEVGEIAAAVGAFKIKAVEKAQREADEETAAQDRAATERRAAMRRLAEQFETAVGNIVGSVSSSSTELEAAANTLTQTAANTQELSGVVAAASEQASNNVQSVASATEEMSASVNEISRQVQESSNIAAEAVRQAQNTDARIAELSRAASRIGDVVTLITAVAAQTNVLALNATIEAARAGDAGRGFAVVASEVKALAGQTAKATSEISTQIAGMQSATQDSVAAIKEIGDTIRRVSEIAATIAAAVEEQGAATQEISRNVQEAAKGTTEVAVNIVSVNRGAGETGSASAQVLSSAQSLSSESSHLKIEVAKFLETVRAA